MYFSKTSVPAVRFSVPLVLGAVFVRVKQSVHDADC